MTINLEHMDVRLVATDTELMVTLDLGSHAQAVAMLERLLEQLARGRMTLIVGGETAATEALQ